MNIHFRIAAKLFTELHADLSRPHAHANERVAFLSCRPAALPGAGVLLLAHALHQVADDDYEPSDTMGALLRGSAFRKALQYVFNHPVSMFHVHRHEHKGHPRFSPVDLEESAKFVPDFWKVRPGHPHGTIVLSKDSAFGLLWHQKEKSPVPLSRFTVVGYPQREVHDDRIR
jgi:hypothetical protein